MKLKPNLKDWSPMDILNQDSVPDLQ